MTSHTTPVTKSSAQEGHSEESIMQPPLEGSCSCGRNQYTIYLPPLHKQPPVAMLVIDTSLASRQMHSTPLPTFLRVPLRSLHSSTVAFYPEERYSDIRRVFTPAQAPRTKRHFCGFCGTQLSFWQEDSFDRRVEEWICVNLGTLKDEHIEVLEDGGILDPVDGENVEKKDMDAVAAENPPVEVVSRGKSGSREMSGQPWFEELIRDTGICRIRQARGGQVSGDGRSRFAWQIVEFDGETLGTAAGDEEDDLEMTGVAESRGSPSKRKVADMNA